MSDDSSSLKKRIQDLEEEIRQREEDLARFRKELGQANRQVEGLIAQVSQELKMAQSIYRQLVPTELPHISGFEFSTKFSPSMISGGDYYDIFEHQDRLRFGLVLSSASGHALSALLLSVLIKMAGQMEGRESPDPQLIVKKIREELEGEWGSNTELDLFYGMVDRRTYTLDFVRMGHVLAFHILENGDLQMLGAVAPPMSVHTSGTAVTPLKVSLNPRERIVLVSRGAALVENVRGEAFGWERVSQSIKSSPKGGLHELRHALSMDIQKFSGGQELKRDVTIVALEVKDKVIRLASQK